MLTRALGDTLAHNHFHHNEVQSGLVNYRRRVGSSGSDGCEVSESVRGSLGGLTWLPWFSPASGTCRAPDGGLGIRASVSGSERANGAVDEPCRSRCIQNSGGFIIWRAAYLRTSAPPKPPASHGRTTVSRTLFVSRGHLRIYLLRFNNEKIDSIKLAITWAPGAARAFVARVDRQVTKEQVCLRTT